MTVSQGVRQKGLFGGLMYERRLNEAGLLDHINRNWNVGQILKLSDLGDWHRGGAETYVAAGRLYLEGDQTQDVIGKAFVGTGLLPERQQMRWEERRYLLRELGVSVPLLIAQYPALSIEQFIPDPFPFANELSPDLAFQAGRIAGALAASHFWPVSMLRDLRVSEGRVYYVDFGSDLGGQGQTREPTWIQKVVEGMSPASRREFEYGLKASGERAT